MPRPILKKLDIIDLINNSLSFIKMTSKNNIELIKKTDETKINGDEDQLNRVFINLIKNSEEAFLSSLEKTLILKVILM